MCTTNKNKYISIIQTYLEHHWSSTMKNIAVNGRAPIDFIDFESRLLLKSARWVKLCSSSSLGSSHCIHLMANSVVQQNCHFLREWSYNLIITTYHTAVMITSNALFTTGKTYLYKVSINGGYLQLCKTLYLGYRCIYISSAIEDESLLILLHSNANVLWGFLAVPIPNVVYQGKTDKPGQKVFLWISCKIFTGQIKTVITLRII